ncbi:MAG: 3-oxoacyl-[acyl-carrier-protein] reductase [Phycisphaeraceae bacterium]|nr:3-oxoacyl-[acyl-carrier-protein] reductase [Phycisphaeraceae bacterium]
MTEATIQRIAVVTGASRGIGEATARALAADGHHVVMLARSVPAMEAIAQQIASNGGQAEALEADITDHAGLAATIEGIAQKHGRLDILVNNAGITRDNLMLRMSDEEFDQVIHANLRSVFITCRAALRPMMRGKWGRIINVGSVAGVAGNAGQANYAAAKAGLAGMTKSLAKEMAAKNITANLVAPGFVETSMTEKLPDTIKELARKATPLGRFGQPEEIAAAIAFLAGERAGFITGQVLAVDGGMTMA